METKIETIKVIIDFGMSYVKIGKSGPSFTAKSFKTPAAFYPSLNSLTAEKPLSVLAKNCEYQSTIEKQIQWFFVELLHKQLQLEPESYEIILCLNVFTPKQMIELLGKIFFVSLKVPKIYYFFGNCLPLFTIQKKDGIVIDCGFLETQICPIHHGYALIDCLKICRVAGYWLGRNLKQKLLSIEYKDISQVNTLFFEKIKGKLKFKLNDIENNSNIDHNSKQQPGSAEITQELLEECLDCFYGDPENEEPNLAYSILSAISDIAYEEVQQVLVQNMVLAGGLVQIPNFKERLMEELNKILNENIKFKRIRKFQKYFSFVKTNYSPSLLKLIGASIQANYKDSELFAITKEQYLDKQYFSEKQLFCFFSQPFA